MTVEVLVCAPDGTDRLEQRQLPEGWFETLAAEAGEE